LGKFLYRHPEMKRLLCSCCDMILWPPLTATVRFSKYVNWHNHMKSLFRLDKRKTGIIVTCSTCGRFRHYAKHNSWPTEHGAHIPSDWLFNSSSLPDKID
jgi:RNase P subunit RPR2